LLWSASERGSSVLLVRQRERRRAHPFIAGAKRLLRAKANEVMSSWRIVAGDRRAVAAGDFGLRGFRQQAELAMYCELK
jgi:hypothetical protein